MAFDFSKTIDIIFAHWYLFIIAIGIIVIIVLLIKLNKVNKIQYHDQVKLNKDIMIDLLSFNPTTIKELIHINKKYKVLGELWFAYDKNPMLELKQMIQRSFSEQEVKVKQYQLMKDYLDKPEKKDLKIAHVFLATSGFISFLGIGKKEMFFFRNEELNLVKPNTIRINDNVRLMYESGFKTTTHKDMLGIATDMTYRLMSDNVINAIGQQQKDFSRIRTDYAHDEVMKDKDIQASQEEKKAKRHG